MFNLITVIISIVLVLALAVSAFYYGGDAYTTKTQETDYVEIVNGATQIKAAMEMYRVRNGEYPGGIEDEILGVSATEELLSRLVSEDYLSGVPRGSWTIERLAIQRELVDVQQCLNVNRLAGLNTALAPDGCPPCSDPEYTTWPACENT